MKTYFNKLASELLEDPYFQKYKFRKRDSSLILKTKYGIQFIELQHWSCGNLILVIHPQYFVRFDVLSKWFEKYSFKTLRDQRDGWYVGFTGDMLSRQDSFEFSYNESAVRYRKELQKLKDCIIECSEYIFEEYSTLEKSYQKELVPILEGRKTLPNVGADWFFENLTLCKIVHPENYEALKAIHLKQAEIMYRRGEPNMSAYYERLPEILEYLENLEFKIGPNGYTQFEQSSNP